MEVRWIKPPRLDDQVEQWKLYICIYEGFNGTHPGIIIRDWLRDCTLEELSCNALRAINLYCCMIHGDLAYINISRMD